MTRWGSLATVTVSGAALAFAFPEPDIAPLAWVSIAPLLYLASQVRPRRGFALGFVFGVAFFGVLLYWISIVGWIAWLLLVLLQALFVGLFGAAYAALATRLPVWGRIAAAGVVWVAVEYLRTRIPLGGFTWGQLAQSQHNAGWMLRPAGLAGSWTVALLLVCCSALVAEAFRAARRGTTARSITLAVGAALLIAAPVLVPAAGASGDELRVAIVQGNVPRGITTSTFYKELSIISSHERLTKTLAGQDVDLVVWPESSVGLDITETPEASSAVAGAARAVDAPMIVGGNLDVDDDRYQVMAFSVSPSGDVIDRYQKTHLVPFGEFVPARESLDWLPMLAQVPRDAVPGAEKTIFDVAGGRVAPVISFEGDFGSLVRERIGGGGQLLVVATNTSTWEESWASAQHVAFSQVRAAENGVWVAHAALSGISAFIAPDGSVVERTPLWTPTTAVEEVRYQTSPTLYARTGDWLPWASLAATACLAVWAARRRTGIDPAPEKKERREGR